jgi:hypothetical protein
MEEFKNEIRETMNKSQQESQARMDQLQQMMEQMMRMNISNHVNTSNNVSTVTASPVMTVTERQPVNRSLLAHLATPVTAVRRNTQAAAVTAHQLPQDTAEATVSAAAAPAEEVIISEETRRALQKGLARPPFFSGDMDEKSESVGTWWRQVYNFASAFETSVQATVIKSYLRGGAASWLESREKEKNRDLTLVELSDGLAQEYGSEITSKAALQKIETLNMGSKECNTLSKYNAAFNKQYNLLSSADQKFAARAYLKGLLPALQKLIYAKNLSLDTLAEVRNAATEVAAEQDAIDLAYKQFRLLANRTTSDEHREKNYTSSSTSASSKSDNYQPYRARRWENRDAFKVNLSSISDNQHDDEETSSSGNDGNEGRPEGQVAAVRANEQNNRPRGRIDNKEITLTTDEVNMLREENRCFRCHKPNHRKRDCRSAPATDKPKPLKDQAPSRK